MVFSRQEYWSGLPCPPPRDRLDLGIEPRFPALQVDSLPSEPPGKPLCQLTGPLKKKKREKENGTRLPKSTPRAGS